ncbi:MAG: hypothetical protein WCT20_05095 [Candidatus Babeliales bacterium]|jgi:hypothetical protein
MIFKRKNYFAIYASILLTSIQCVGTTIETDKKTAGENIYEYIARLHLPTKAADEVKEIEKRKKLIKQMPN